MTEKILLVDDDENILHGYKRQLRKLFTIETAGSGVEGLKRVLEKGPFAVIVSDFRMPEMDGIQFFTEAKVHAPDSVRIMLSGNADLRMCIEAVNEGNIFRFLTKPCPPEVLTKTLEAGVEHHRLLVVEKELLRDTFSGTVGLLTDVLGLMNPTAFSRASRIRPYVRHVAAELNADYFWHYDMAAALSQIGQVALPPYVLDRMSTGRPLNGMHRSVLARHPAIGCELLANIPRLELVAQMVLGQDNAPRGSVVPTNVETDKQAIAFGSLLLKLALDLDGIMEQGNTFILALKELLSLYGPDHPMVVTLMSFEKGVVDRVVMEIKASGLAAGMVAAQDIVTNSGHVVVAKGKNITDPVLHHLQTYAQSEELAEPFQVEVLSPSASS